MQQDAAALLRNREGEATFRECDYGISDSVVSRSRASAGNNRLVIGWVKSEIESTRPGHPGDSRTHDFTAVKPEARESPIAASHHY